LQQLAAARATAPQLIAERKFASGLVCDKLMEIFQRAAIQ
jgi:hypothetical protein